MVSIGPTSRGLAQASGTHTGLWAAGGTRARRPGPESPTSGGAGRRLTIAQDGPAQTQSICRPPSSCSRPVGFTFFSTGTR